jgi:hypothetical protein
MDVKKFKKACDFWRVKLFTVDIVTEKAESIEKLLLLLLRKRVDWVIYNNTVNRGKETVV